MKRNIIEKLLEWKERGAGCPLFLSGMRGCGKTYLAMEFAKSFYEGMLYLNFEQKSAKERALLAEMEPMHTIDDFAAYICRLFDVPAEYLDRFLIVLDEAYEERAVWDFLVLVSSAVSNAGVFFGENTAKISAGVPGNLGESAVKSKRVNLLILSSRMPALPKYFCHLNLYPLQFDEFLAATGQEWYSDVIRGHFETNHRIPGIVHEELSDRFEDYLCTGGMPAAVNEYLSFERTDNLPEVHQMYLGHILHNIYRHYKEGEALKMRQVLEVLPAQLNKENQKFQYRLIRRGATQSLYKKAIQELCSAQLILLCTREDKRDLFRAFPSDIGLLYALAQEGAEKREAGESFHNQLLESYVMQTLVSCGYQPTFWESCSQARIDFLIEMDNLKIPIELKTAGNMRSRSIGVYRASHKIPYSFRISDHNFDFSNQVKTVPYYAVFCL